MTQHNTLLQRSTTLSVTCALCLWASVSLAQDDKGTLPPKTLSVGAASTTGATSTTPTTKTSKKVDKGTIVEIKDLIRPAVGTSASAANTVRKSNGVLLSKVKHAFDGLFNQFHSRNKLPQLITFQDNTLTYHSGTYRVSRLKDVQLVSKKTLKVLNAGKRNIVAVQLIQDGTTQVLAWRSVKNKRGDTLYKMTIYKVFGRYFGKALDQTVGVKLAGKSKIKRTANVEFVQGKKHIDVRVTPYSRKGELLTNAVQTHTYHKWEGIYRVPSQVPTSPKRIRSAMKR